MLQITKKIIISFGPIGFQVDFSSIENGIDLDVNINPTWTRTSSSTKYHFKNFSESLFSCNDLGVR